MDWIKQTYGCIPLSLFSLEYGELNEGMEVVGMPQEPAKCLWTECPSAMSGNT